MNNKFIYCPNGEFGWDKNTFTTPHARLISPDVIRIWGGCRDDLGISRIRYIDVDANEPSKILYISDRPSLDIGNLGCFDDNGVILGDIIEVDSKLYLYYVGFQHVQKVKFFAFTGLAISEDEGVSFYRYSETPILDRTDTARFGRCAHTVLYEDGVFKCYYAVINDWKIINSIPYPIYDIWLAISDDGIHFPHNDRHLCVTTENSEYRIGRPKVYRTQNGYEMFYTRDLVTKEYLAGYAISQDGYIWERCDDKLPLKKSGQEWDSKEACYPVKLITDKDTYIFYNGNGMGKEGFGYMRLAN